MSCNIMLQWVLPSCLLARPSASLTYGKVFHLYYRARATTGAVAVASPLPENHCQPVRSCVQESARRPVPFCRVGALCCSWQCCHIMKACSNSPFSLATEHRHLPKNTNYNNASCLVVPQEPVGRTLALCPATHLQGELVRLSQQHKVCLGFRGCGLGGAFRPSALCSEADCCAEGWCTHSSVHHAGSTRGGACPVSPKRCQKLHKVVHKAQAMSRRLTRCMQTLPCSHPIWGVCRLTCKKKQA